jgi:hypothetical protein
MDSFKPFHEIMRIDKQHLFLTKMGGKKIELASHHQSISSIQLHAGVPQTVRGSLILPGMWQFIFSFFTP